MVDYEKEERLQKLLTLNTIFTHAFTKAYGDGMVFDNKKLVETIIGGMTVEKEYEDKLKTEEQRKQEELQKQKEEEEEIARRKYSQSRLESVD